MDGARENRSGAEGLLYAPRGRRSYLDNWVGDCIAEKKEKYFKRRRLCNGGCHGSSFQSGSFRKGKTIRINKEKRVQKRSTTGVSLLKSL